jgi:hypothetical protein
MKHLRYSLFWDDMQRGLEVSYLHFGTTCRSILQGSSSPYPRNTWVLGKVVGTNVGNGRIEEDHEIFVIACNPDIFRM